MAPLLFGDQGFKDDAQISINELRQKFENLGVQVKKSTQLSRFLIEQPSQGEIIYNEDLRITCNEVVTKLQNLIGVYHLYHLAESEEATSSNADDPHFVQEEYMKKLVLENFARYQNTLVEALGCEDYEETGLLELSQLQEAISTVNEELESGVLDYMLYYVLVRSESAEKMQYKALIDLLEDLINSKSRVASASRKNRPESSSPEKLKMRNPQMAAAGSSGNKPDDRKAIKVDAGDNEDEGSDEYSDEEIANDPDEEDDGTKNLEQAQKLKSKESNDEKAKPAAATAAAAAAVDQKKPEKQTTSKEKNDEDEYESDAD